MDAESVKFVQNEDQKSLTIFLNGDVDINVFISVDSETLTLLSVAVRNNRYGICKFLLDEGANVNIQDDLGNTALSWSTYSNVDSDIMKLLLDYGADSNYLDKFNNTAFNSLLHSFDPIKAQYLLDSDMASSINVIDTITGDNILSSSIWLLHKHSNHCREDDIPICVKIAEKLIELGVDIHLLNNIGNSVLHTAAKAGCYDSVKLLIKHGCDPNSLNEFGLAPIHILSQQQGFDCFDETNRPFQNLRALIDGTFDEVDNTEKPIDSKYLENSVIDCLYFLLDHGVDVNLRSKAGNSSLHIACEKANYAFKNAIIECGADVNCLNVAGRRSSLHILLNMNNPDIKEEVYRTAVLLIEKGADVSQKCNRGWNSLFYAVFRKNNTIIDLLLTHTIDLKTRDNFGLSVLHVAICTSVIKCVQRLLQSGCQVNAVDMYGSTPLFYALVFGWFDMAKLLVQNGGDIHHTDNSGNSIKDILLQRGEDLSDRNIVNLLDELHQISSSIISKKFEQDEGTKIKRSEISNTQSSTPDWSINPDPFLTLNDQEYLPLEIVDVPLWIENQEWKHSIGKKISNFISEPLIFEENESKLMMHNVKAFMERLSVEVMKLEPAFSFTPVLSGSTSEGTKITYPDEFDFLICLDKFQDKVDIIETDDMPASYCAVKLNANYKYDNISKLFDANGQLNTNKLAMKIYNMIYHILSDSEIWKDLGLHWQNGPPHDSKTISALELYWVGPLYKMLPISVDVVLAVSMKNWWPSSASLERNIISNEMQEEGCILIMKSRATSDDTHLFRISFSKTETEIISKSSNTIKRGYMLAKSIRSWIPECVIHIDGEDDGDSVSAEFLFSSYVLKTSLLEELEEYFQENNKQISNSNNSDYTNVYEHSNNSATGVAYRIWRRIENAVNSGEMSSFFISTFKVYEMLDTDGEIIFHGYSNIHAQVLSHMIAEILEVFTK